MTATLTRTYQRSAQEARRIAEAFRASTRGVNGKLLREYVAELTASELPERVNGRHSPGFVAAISKVAALMPKEDRDDARAFAKRFIDKPAAYSRTAAGLAAVQFEAWLIENGGVLYAKFVETVLDCGEKNFLAIFEGKLIPQDMEKMRLGTGAFMKLEPIAEAGSVNYDTAEMLEFSMFDCEAIGKAKEKDVFPTSIYDPNQPSVMNDRVPTYEMLLPQTRADYDRVYEQEGISRSVAMFLLGERSVSAATIEEGKLVILDANGTRWISETGDTWLPDVDALEEAREEEQAIEEEEPEPTRQLYEVNPNTGAMRSYCNSWAVFVNPVLMEGEAKPATVISAKCKAWAVARPFEEVSKLVTDAAVLYEDSPVEGDLFIEAVLAEYAVDHGTPCVNEEEVVQLVSEVPGRPTRWDRDADVNVLCAQRLMEDIEQLGYVFEVDDEKDDKPEPKGGKPEGGKPGNPS